MEIAPFFFALSSVTAVLAVVAFFQALRAAFGAEPVAESFEGGRHRPGRAALVDEKEALLRTIKDLAFEREVGKISDEDFERLDREYRQRAKEVLRELDEDLAPYFERAESLFDRAFREAEADVTDEASDPDEATDSDGPKVLTADAEPQVVEAADEPAPPAEPESAAEPESPAEPESAAEPESPAEPESADDGEERPA